MLAARGIDSAAAPLRQAAFGGPLLDVSAFGHSDVCDGRWTQRIIADPKVWLARRVSDALSLGFFPRVPAPPALPSSAGLAATSSAAIAARQLQAAILSSTAAPEDLFVQSLFGVGEGSEHDIYGGVGGPDSRAHKEGRSASAAAAAKGAVRTGDSSDLQHSIQASELSLRVHHRRKGGYVQWHRPPPPVGSRDALAPFIPAKARTPLLSAVAAAKAVAAAAAANKKAGLADDGSIHRRYGAIATGSSTGAVRVTTSVRAGAGGTSVSRKEDLSATEGEVLLFEYSEQRPPILSQPGMANRIVTYYRVSNDDEIIEDKEEEDESGGGGGGGRSRRAVNVPRVDEGAVEVLKAREPFPMLGVLEPGTSLTTISNNLFRAPIFRHDPQPTDFLLCLRFDKLSSHPLLSKAATVNMAAQAKAAAASGAAAPPPAAMQLPKRMHALYVRELGKVFTVGQVQPRAEVFAPPTRNIRGIQVFEPGLAAFLRAYCCWHLLSLMEALDEAYERSLLAAGKLQPGQHAAPGVISARQAFQDLDMDIEEESYLSFVAGPAGVADYDKSKHILIRRQGRRSDDLRAEQGLGPDKLALFDGMRAGMEILPFVGLRALRADDKTLDDALRHLQTMYDKMVDRLKAASAKLGPSSSSGGDESELWEHDGGYRRMRRTLEVAQAAVYMVAMCPWATTRNFIAYTTRNDISALAMADPAGVGDPSGRGEAFSFIREMTNRIGMRSRLLPTEKKEGTARDVRTLTNPQMMQMLMEYGVPIQQIRRMSRWKRAAAIRDKQNEELVALASGGAVRNALLFTGESKLTSRERKRIKDEQAKEIARRQYFSLADASAADEVEDEGEDEDDSEFAAELERAFGAGRRKTNFRTQQARKEAARRLEEEDERIEFEKFKKWKQSLLTNGGSGAGGGGDGDMTDAAARSAATNALFPKFPLPDELLRPPHAPLVSSFWDKQEVKPAVAAPVAASAGVGGGSGEEESGGTEELTDAVEGGTLTTANRKGARSPSSLKILPSPALESGQEPRFLKDPQGVYKGSGKILRVVRTVVDETGRQRVFVTYTLNKYALQQAWLKHNLKVDLGTLGIHKRADETGYGLLATGFYKRAGESMAARRALEAEHTLFRTMHPRMLEMGLRPREMRFEKGKNRMIDVLSILVNGSELRVCPLCSLWGHRKPACPFYHKLTTPTAMLADKEIEENAQKERAAWLARQTLKVTVAPLKPVTAADAAVGLKRKREDGTAATGSAAAAQAAAAADTSSVLGNIQPMRHLMTFVPIRQFALTLERLLSPYLCNDTFERLWRAADTTVNPEAATLPNRMDLYTIRAAILERKYTTWESFRADFARVRSTCESLFGSSSPSVRLWERIDKETLTEYERKSRKDIKRIEEEIVAQQGRHAFPMANQRLLEAIELGVIKKDEPPVNLTLTAQEPEPQPQQEQQAVTATAPAAAPAANIAPASAPAAMEVAEDDEEEEIELDAGFVF
jgi:hypothetical protein